MQSPPAAPPPIAGRAAGAAQQGGAESAAELPRGTPLDRYLILKKLGAGGMGVVYEAHDPELDRLVAIKLVRSDNLDPARASQGRARMLREAQAMARLSHPNVITVHDIGMVGTQIFVAMEYVSGGTLREWLAQERRDWRQILDMFTLAGRGLAAAHAAELIHRDFKPDNVLVGKDGRVRVTDFGLARSAVYSDAAVEGDGPTSPAAAPVGAAFDTPLTDVGMVVGTPRFLPPEQIAGGRADHRSDQFSFCVSLYEALYGNNPFAGRAMDVRYENMQRGALVPPDPETTADPPAWVRDVLARGLSGKPEARFPDIPSLLEALSWRTRKRRRLLTAVAITAASLLLIGMGGLILRPYYVCRGSTRKLRPIWNEDKKRGLPASLVASIDRYLADWAPTYRSACLASQRDPRFAAVLDCLDRRKQDMQSLIEIASSREGTDGETWTRRASEAPYRMPSIRACVNTANVPPPSPLPGDRAIRTELATLLQELSRARVRLALEQCDKAEAESRSAVARAARIRYKPVEAEAFFLSGMHALQCRDPEQAQTILTDSTHAAKEGHHLLVLADGLAWRAAILSWQQRSEEDLARQQKRAASALSAHVVLRDAKVEGPELLKQRCMIEVALHDARALGDCQEALARYTQWLGADHVETAMVESELAALLSRQQKFDGALAAYQRALVTFNKYLERHNLLVIKTMISAAETLCAAGRCSEARPLLAGVLERRREQGLPPVQLAGVLDKLQRILADGGQYQEAARYLDQAIEIFLGESGRHEFACRTLLPSLIRYFENAGDYEQAQRQAERLLAESIASTGPGGFHAADAHSLIGEVLNARGQHKAALPHLEQAVGILNLQGKELYRKRALTALGAALLGMGRPKVALARLREAQHVVGTPASLRIFPSAAEVAADTDFTLARTLRQLDAKGNAGEIQNLIESARRGYTESGRISQRKLDTFAAWTSQRGSAVSQTERGPIGADPRRR